MRILQVGSGNLFGGIEVCQQTLAKYAPSCPELVQEYAYFFDGDAANAIRAANLPVHVLGDVRYSRPWTAWKPRANLCRLLRERSYDAVVCHELWVYGIVASAVRKASVPLVLWIHDQHGRGGVLEFLARRVPPDLVIANSGWSARTMPEFLPGVPAKVVYCPVEADEDTPPHVCGALRRRFQTSDTDVVVLQVGRWEPHKGHLMHLSALATMGDLPQWVCWQVGAPQRPSEERYFDQVRAAADRLGIASRVRFLGWQPDLAAIRAAADIYCQPNTEPEPFGLTLVEALSAGLPVVAAAEAGPLEIVTRDCGWLVRSSDSLELAEALRDLVSKSEVRRQLGKHGRARAKELCDPTRQLGLLARVLGDRLQSKSMTGASNADHPPP